MLRNMLHTNICIYVIKNRPVALRERIDQLAEELCISTITRGEFLYRVEKSARQCQNLEAAPSRYQREGISITQRATELSGVLSERSDAPRGIGTALEFAGCARPRDRQIS